MSARPISKSAIPFIFFGLSVAANAAPGWNENSAPPVKSFNCITTLPETLGVASVAWMGDPMNPPAVNTVYYARISWFVSGKPCIGGARISTELFLPDGTALAISAATPVKCFSVNLDTGAVRPAQSDCPQAPAQGFRGGLRFAPVTATVWPTPPGTGWEIHVPLKSTSALSGVLTSNNAMTPCPDCLTASVWFADGIFNPESFPRVAVVTKGVVGAPEIIYGNPPVDTITNISAIGHVTFKRNGTTGTLKAEDGDAPLSASTCVPNSIGDLTITAQTAASLSLDPTITQLQPGTLHHWRICYVTGNTTIIGATKSFKTTGKAPPRILSVLPEIAAPGRKVTVIGTDLDGATSVVINGKRSSLGVFIAGAAPESLTFDAPAMAVTGTVSVTTPAGTATSGSQLTVGIDTFFDEITPSAPRRGGSTQGQVKIQFHSSEPFPSVRMDCQLDGALLAKDCSSGEVIYSDLSPGNHFASITSYAGNLRDTTPLVVNFTILNADTTPPETTLLTGPQQFSFINSGTATFTFSSEAGASFECALDSVTFWAPCSSPHTVTGLADGSHTFAVRAKDAAFNLDPTPGETLFTVDTVPPETQLFSVVPAPNVTITTSRTGTFTFASQSVMAFQCSFDMQAWSPCLSPMTYENLLNGIHSFQVRAVDRAGNIDPSPAMRTWTVQDMRMR